MARIASIPTLFNGVQYRSRLEARWAAMFGLLGWRFQYEPFDLPGWIPDFLLLFRLPMVVEVKPVASFPEDVATEIEASDPAYAPLIVGCTLLDSEGDDLGTLSTPFLGWVRRDCGGWSLAGVATFDSDRDRFAFLAAQGAERATDYVTGRQINERRNDAAWESWKARRLWHEAGNLVQWRSPRSVALSPQSLEIDASSF